MADERDAEKDQRTVDCAQRCPIPEGVELHPVPEPRHAWGDVIGCPNDDCYRWFLVSRIPSGRKSDYVLDGSPESVALVREARGLPPSSLPPAPTTEES